MAKLVNYKAILLTMAIFAIGLGSTFTGVAFADDQDSMYSHQHITASWDHGLCAETTNVLRAKHLTILQQ